MNKVFLIGNLTADPVSRTTQSGVSFCNFTIAVNRKQSANAGQPDVDFFRITAWRQLGEICSKYLTKGRKVSVIGSISASAYAAADGKPRASMDVQADDIEFLTPKENTQQNAPQVVKKDKQTGYIQVGEDDLPF